MLNRHLGALTMGIIATGLASCALPTPPTTQEPDSVTSARVEVLKWPKPARDARQYLRQRPHMGEAERRAYVASHGLPLWFGRRPTAQPSSPAPLIQLLSGSDRAGLDPAARAIAVESWNYVRGKLHVCPSQNVRIERLYYPPGNTNGPCIADTRIAEGGLSTISPIDLAAEPSALPRLLEGRWAYLSWVERRGQIYVLVTKQP